MIGTSSVEDERRAAREYFHELLRGDVLEGTRTALEQARSDPGLGTSGPNTFRILRPCLIRSGEYEAVQRCAVAATQALESLYRAACDDADLRRALGVPRWQERALELEPRNTPPLVGRLDGLPAVEGGVRFLEYNTMPGGIYEMLRLGNVFSASPALRLFAQRYPLTRPDPFEATFRALTAGKKTLPQMAVIDWPKPGLAPDLDALAGSLRRRGIAIHDASVRGPWRSDGGRLWLSEHPIDLVFFLDPLRLGGFLSACSLDEPLIHALRQGDAQVLGGLFRTLFLASKRVFAALSDPVFRQLVPAELRPILDGCIPWTRTLGEGQTTHAGAEVDLVPFVARHREQLVLKPALGQGGAGVVLGWRTTDQAWQEALRKAVDERWVVQERVVSIRDTYPLWRDGRVEFEDLWWDINPFVWRASTADGCLVRAGSDPLLNTSSGSGSITGLFVLD